MTCQKCADLIVENVTLQSQLDAARRGMLLKSCEQCGGTFQTKRPDARTCSGACRLKLHRAKRYPWDD